MVRYENLEKETMKHKNNVESIRLFKDKIIRIQAYLYYLDEWVKNSSDPMYFYLQQLVRNDLYNLQESLKELENLSS